MTLDLRDQLPGLARLFVAHLAPREISGAGRRRRSDSLDRQARAGLSG